MRIAVDGDGAPIGFCGAPGVRKCFIGWVGGYRGVPERAVDWGGKDARVDVDETDFLGVKREVHFDDAQVR